MQLPRWTQTPVSSQLRCETRSLLATGKNSAVKAIIGCKKYHTHFAGQILKKNENFTNASTLVMNITMSQMSFREKRGIFSLKSGIYVNGEDETPHRTLKWLLLQNLPRYSKLASHTGRSISQSDNEQENDTRFRLSIKIVLQCVLWCIPTDWLKRYLCK